MQATFFRSPAGVEKKKNWNVFQFYSCVFQFCTFNRSTFANLEPLEQMEFHLYTNHNTVHLSLSKYFLTSKMRFAFCFSRTPSSIWYSRYQHVLTILSLTNFVLGTDLFSDFDDVL